ncbi:ribonuclease III [bacterium]|nr:ribonuclease III [bacterium]
MIKEELALRNYAHIGDSVWELFVRNYVIYKTSNSKLLHKMTTERVNAIFQKDLLLLLTPNLSDDEKELARRARNLPIPIGRRNIQSDYRQATAFEVLIGYWYLHDFQRLENIYNQIKSTEFFK